MTTAVAVGMRLELDDVRLSYTGAPVVDGLSLVVRPGEILVLTGPSGCGKSTVLRALAGLLLCSAVSANRCVRSSMCRNHAPTTSGAKPCGQKSLRLSIIHDADT